MREPWKFENPACASVGGDFWFPERTQTPGEIDVLTIASVEVTMAKSVCNSCIHKVECKQWGLKHEYHGIWGGLSEGERRPIRQRLGILVEEVRSAYTTTGVGDSTHQGYTST